MQGPFDQQKAIMAQRMAGSTGAPSGGLGPPGGSPPPPMGGQQPMGGAPMGAEQPSEAKPLLDQAFKVILRGNPADLQALGEFMAQIKSLVDRHNSGQGQMQMGAAPPAPTTL